jgi:uncharacterized membrane protein YccC
MSRTAPEQTLSVKVHAPIDWNDVRTDYEVAIETMPEIARRHGLMPSDIRRAAKVNGWNRARLSEDPDITAEDLSYMAQRILQVTAAKLAQIERDIAGDASAADIESHARTLTALTRSMERLEALKRRLAASPERAGDTEDADTIRARVERRLARLAEPGDSP